VVIRAVRADVSAVENTLDALDTVDVATGVVAIRDEGDAFSGVLRTTANCADDFGSFESLEDGLVVDVATDVAMSAAAGSLRRRFARWRFVCRRHREKGCALMNNEESTAVRFQSSSVLERQLVGRRVHARHPMLNGFLSEQISGSLGPQRDLPI
jgi:hypothetical protein